MRQASRLAILIVFCTQVLALFVYYPKWKLPGTEALISWDVAGYYMYLPATFIYHDLAGTSYHEQVTSTYGPSPQFDHGFQHESGAFVMKYPLGMAIQYAPFFAVAHAFAKTSDAYPADGFSRPYQIALALETLFFALLSLLLLRKLLRRYFNETTAAWTILSIGVGTNYLEYSSIGGAHAHLNLFVYYALVVLAAERFYRRASWSSALVIGACIGMATLTRPTELMMVALPLLWGIQLNKTSITERFKYLFAAWPKLIAAAGIGGTIIAIQPLYWHSITGDWIVYSYQDQGFSFLHPHIWKGFASFRAGWITYTPLGILMMLGFYPLYRQYPRLVAGLALYLAMFMYVGWSWDIWWYGGSFGQRIMVQVYPLLALPLAALVSWSETTSRVRKILFALAFGVCILVSLFWNHQAHLGGMLKVGEMTGRYYAAQLFRFDRPTERLKLLDHARIYRGVLVNPDTVLHEQFESVTDEPMLCQASEGLDGGQSLCIQIEAPFSNSYRARIPGVDKTWLRASFDFELRAKTWDSWAMAQVIVEFKRGDQVLKAHFLRPERLLDGGRQNLHFDMPLPDPGSYDELSVKVWKPGLGGLVLLDNLVLTAFEG